MPVYVYEAADPAKGCAKCGTSFEVVQSIRDAPLAECPECGAAVRRVIQAPGLTHSKTDLHDRAKRAGFHTLKKVGRGAYEKMY